MKLNHFKCPNCGHDFYSEGACVSCDACQCHFYAGQSLTVTKIYLSQKTNPNPLSQSTMTPTLTNWKWWKNRRMKNELSSS